MIDRIVKNGGWYGDCTVAGDTVTLFRAIVENGVVVKEGYIEINNSRLELPTGQSNLLQLVCTIYHNQILVAGQGQSYNNWLWKDGKWHDLGPSFATFSCAFGPGSLYYVVGPNQYRILDLESMIAGPIVPRAIGSNGIRYINFDQSYDGIVTGDSTYGPQPYNLSQWSQSNDLIIGQSYIDGCVAQFGGRYKIEPGDTQFIRLHRKDNKIAIAIVKMLEKSTVYYFMDAEDILLFPEECIVSDKKPGPVNNTEEKKMPTAPNKLSTVQRMIKLHPEIDTMDEEKRGKILDYVIKAEGGKPWGRKARNKDGSNKNTDGLTYLVNNGEAFEIYDVISGGDGSATWDYAGTFKQGENGYWAEGEPVSGDSSKPPVEEKPKPKFNKDDVRDGANRIIGFYTSQDGLQRSKPPIDVNDQAAWDWVALFLLYLLDGKNTSEAVEDVLKQIRMFPEWKNKHS